MGEPIDDDGDDGDGADDDDDDGDMVMMVMMMMMMMMMMICRFLGTSCYIQIANLTMKNRSEDMLLVNVFCY